MTRRGTAWQALSFMACRLPAVFLNGAPAAILYTVIISTGSIKERWGEIDVLWGQNSQVEKVEVSKASHYFWPLSTRCPCLRATDTNTEFSIMTCPDLLVMYFVLHLEKPTLATWRAKNNSNIGHKHYVSCSHAAVTLGPLTHMLTVHVCCRFVVLTFFEYYPRV